VGRTAKGADDSYLTRDCGKVVMKLLYSSLLVPDLTQLVFVAFNWIICGIRRKEHICSLHEQTRGVPA
jgi:hypothetical protein